jgi:hypothetical protein
MCLKRTSHEGLGQRKLLNSSSSAPLKLLLARGFIFLEGMRTQNTVPEPQVPVRFLAATWESHHSSLARLEPKTDASLGL